MRRWPVLLAVMLLVFEVLIPIADASYSPEDDKLSGGQTASSISFAASPFDDDHRKVKDFSVKVTPASQKILAGEKADYAVIVSSRRGFHEEVTLTLRGLPLDIKATLQPNSGECPFTSTLEIVTDPKALPRTYTFDIVGSSEKKAHFTVATLAVVSTGTPSADFSIAASPSSTAIDPGENAQYIVALTSLNGFSGKVSLSLTGAPSTSTSTFSHEELSLDGNKVTSSTLSVSTDQSTTPGTYALMVTGVAEAGGQTHQTTVVLVLLGAKTALSVTISTEELSYEVGSSVSLSGYVGDPSGPVVDAAVSIQVVDPEGAAVHVVYVRTGGSGYYSDSFRLGGDAGAGTYAVYVTASKPGYQDASDHSTFTVGSSSTPNVVITNVYTTDMSRKTKTVFHPGETLIVWVEFVNTGADLVDGMVWVQIADPNGAPIGVYFHVGLMARGHKVKEGFSITLPSNAPQGEYRVASFVSDKMIYEGGQFFTTKQGKFKVS